MTTIDAPAESLSARVGTVVAELISDAGMTVAAVAHKTGISRVALARRLRGTVPFTIDELVAVLAEVGDLRPSDVVLQAEAMMVNIEGHPLRTPPPAERDEKVTITREELARLLRAAWMAGSREMFGTCTAPLHTT
jgi:transcriptional regulator with XRE-family HTH domain